MELIKEARVNNCKYVQRVQCGWNFSPYICVKEEIFLETPFEAICLKCNQSSIIDELEKFCEKCHQCNVYSNVDIIYDKIYDFDFEILDKKDTLYLDISTLYNIKINEFYGTMFCGVYKEANELSLSPQDDYLCVTFLFTNEELCNEEYKSLKKLKEYLKN